MDVLATTTAGKVRGVDRRGLLRFRGIPFAAPTTASGRFRPPRPHEGWSGVRDAADAGPVCPQGEAQLERMLGAPPEPQSEDCLHLNVWTPGLDDERRPVMVWIHGGGFVMGSGTTPLYQGWSFAARGVVLVTLNYRLGELGFLHLDHLDEAFAGSGSVGTLDQIAALEWVRDNIASFGGDPGNVTIFGESAGAMSVGTLLGTPAAAGLFHAAILQSGAASMVRSAATAEAVTAQVQRHLGTDDPEALLAAPVERLVAARAALVARMMVPTEGLAETRADGEPLTLLPFAPTVDGHVLAQHPLDAVAAGAPVPLVIGTNADEWRLFALLDQGGIDDAELGRRMRAVVGARAEEVLDAYRRLLPGAAPAELFGEMAGDFAFHAPAARLAAAAHRAGGRVHKYRFAWRSPALGGLLGACHALDLPFVFDVVDRPAASLFVGDGPPPTDLAGAMNASWAAFASTRDPDVDALPHWPRYDPADPHELVLDQPPTVAPEHGTERLAWWP